ncbi:NAD-dependent protein deacetylase, SIR2 family [Gracilibacillus ureilyticus]|uniref:NAD-dependent protein deacetylase, SIR2 family n=1 Tax=Gracilibacillus ureilyticus TaxID=531814 RepID=A0A1H9T902_9BACI|nr:Sir2 silent information regulator family NAD-dependent deacetylase [Gracilibacillus ureilyticus]SER93616.1 NAD-dependent protein deacetylase, SIR2 family [Gracilibacillus ureilyticus]
MRNDYQVRLNQMMKRLEEAEYILVGGGAGLSAAAGLDYTGERFTNNFSSFIDKYGFTDLYSSSFYPFETQEERWAYWAKHISVNLYEIDATKLYEDLYQLVKDKKYFVITTNVESQFTKAGIPSDKVFEIQGNYGYLQCERGCHQKLYYNELVIKEMLEKTKDCRIPSSLVPKCPKCNGEMDVNLRHNEFFVQDDKWNQSDELYREFLQEAVDKKIVYLELGVGFNTPGIIRYPFEKLTYHNKKATLIRFNKNDHQGFQENKKKTITFTEDIQDTIMAIGKY